MRTTLFKTTRKEVDGSEISLPQPLEEIYPGAVGDVLTLTVQGYEAKPLGAFSNNGQQYFAEVLTIAVANTIPPLSFRPKYATRDVMMIIGDGWLCPRVEQGGFTVNVTSGIITLTPGAEYSLYAGLEVTMVYATDDAIAPPSISNVFPSSVSVGDTLTIVGSNFSPSAVVRLGGQIVSATYVNSTTITVIVPALMYVGNSVSVQTIIDTATATGFNFVSPIPTITGFTPSAQQFGQSVIITGNNFTGASQVRFGGINAAGFVVNSPTQITAVLGTGASGTIEVVTPYGTASRSGFTYVVTTPTITSFNPTSAAQFSSVIITGTNFTGVTQVQFGGVNAQSFTIDSATQITAIVGTGASGSVAVTSPSGTASLAGFTHRTILPFPSAPNRLATGFSGTLSNGANYTIRASKDINGNRWQAFDDPIQTTGGTYWYAIGAAGVDEWIEIEFSDPVLVASVDIIAFPLGFQPVNFRFMISDVHSTAGVGYATVLNVSGETWPLNTWGESKNYVIPVANRQARKIFRMQVSSTVQYGNQPAIYSIILKP